MLDAGVLPRIHGIGPASTRIILEVLEHGFSPTVERAIVESGQQHEIARRRALRTGFLSRAEVVRLIALEASPPRRSDRSDARRGPHAWRAPARPSARPHVRLAAGHHRGLGSRVR